MKVELWHRDGSRSVYPDAEWAEMGRLESGKRYIKVCAGRSVRLFVWSGLRQVRFDGRKLDGMR